MSNKLEFLLPKFGRDHWHGIGAATRAGETRAFTLFDTAIRERRLFDPLDAAFRGLAREAKPTIWAHAETFLETLAAEIDQKPRRTDAEHFQVWAGLLAALFQGDLEAVRVPAETLKRLDEDLYPALHAGLPIEPDEARWPPVLYRLHGEGGLTVLRTGSGGAVVGACYGPCLVFPALETPTPDADPGLEKFQVPGAAAVTFRLSQLMEHYGRQEGFAEAFDSVLGRLAEQLAESQQGSLFGNLYQAVELLRTVLATQYGASGRAVEERLTSEPRSFLGYRYHGLDQSEVWSNYPLRALAPGAGGGATPVLFIAEGIDVALNPWATRLAFPGTADRSRLCDLTVRIDPENQVVEVLGRNRQVYQVPSDHQVLSLSPQAPARLRAVGGALFYLEGANALDPALLHQAHADWRRTLTKRDDVTPLLPLHSNLLRLFPQFIAAPGELVRLASGAVGANAATEALCRLTLPLPKGTDFDALRQVSWKTRLIGWKLDEMRLPQADVWPTFRAVREPRWSAYFVRTLAASGRLSLRFHGEDGVAEPAVAAAPHDAQDTYTFTRLTSPPRLAEVLQTGQAGAEEPQQAGLLFLSGAVFRDAEQQSRLQAGIDFGTSNTSVALRGDGATKPRVLELRPWAGPLVQPRPERRLPQAVQPGWFLEAGGDDSGFHRGFFPTLLGYRLALARDLPLLQGLANPGGQTAADLAGLVGVFDLLGTKGQLALDIRDSTLLPWGVEDNLKWASPGDSPEQDLRRRAFRMAFLELLLLHVAAEVFAKTGALPSHYTFTYPLSMKPIEARLYENAARRAVEVVEELACPGGVNPKEGPNIAMVDESQAVFRAYNRSHREKKEEYLPESHRVVLIDMGGGSADYAVFAGGPRPAGGGIHPGDQLCFLDSMVLAGNRLFSFFQDISSDAEYATFKKSIESMTGLPAWFPDLACLRDDAVIGKLRQFYTLRVGEMMPDKSPSYMKNRDIRTLDLREATVAEEVAPKIDRYAPGHWMRSLFHLVLTHGLLLAVAPIPGRPLPSAIYVVLAGNGWGLLPHAGVARSAARITTLVKALYRELKRAMEGQGPPESRPRLPEADEVKVRLMDDIVSYVLDGQAVYSKDLVAAGGLIEGAGGSGSSACGIVGFDLAVLPDGQTGADGGPQPRIVLPWYSSVGKEQVDDFILREVGRLSPNGHGDGSETIKVARVSPDPATFQPVPGPESVARQLQALDLMKTGGYTGPAARMLDKMGWEAWNSALHEIARTALDVYGTASSEHTPDTTSLVRAIWEYPLLHREVRHTLLQMMSGGR